MKVLRHIKLGRVDNWENNGLLCNYIRFKIPTIVTSFQDKIYIVLVNNNKDLSRHINVKKVKSSPNIIKFIRANSAYKEQVLGPIILTPDTLDWHILGIDIKRIKKDKAKVKKHREKVLTSFIKVLKKNNIPVHLRNRRNRNDLVYSDSKKEYKILGILDIENGFSGVLTLKWKPKIIKKYIKEWQGKSTSGWDIKGVYQLINKKIDIESELANQVAVEYGLKIKNDYFSKEELSQMKKIQQYIIKDNWIFNNEKNWKYKRDKIITVRKK